MTWLGWLIIGAVLGWLISMLLDWNWWSDRRYCSEDELRLRSEVDELEGRVAEFKRERAQHKTEQSKSAKRVSYKKVQKSKVGAGVVGAGLAGAGVVAAKAKSARAKKPERLPVNKPGKKIAADDLQKIWGIGPASETVLNDNGIYTYEQLGNSNQGELRTMLDDSRGTFNMVREDTWPEQARLAANGQWHELAAQHESITTHYVTNEFTGEYKGKKDKLTKIWGIGQAVQRVLYSKGVYRFEHLAGMPLPMLQGIITAAGDNFAYVKPELWIPQAKLAAAGDMQALNVLKKKINAEHG